MYACATCERVVDDGVFLPGEESDFVCLACFKTRHKHEPHHEATASATLINQQGVRHRPGKPAKRPTVNYIVVVSTLKSSTKKVLKRIFKKNLLTLKNLPPGSYYF